VRPDFPPTFIYLYLYIIIIAAAAAVVVVVVDVVFGLSSLPLSQGVVKPLMIEAPLAIGRSKTLYGI
jgi:hypothetical protein